ncbi:MAG: nucleosidase, partial [Hyphomicrobiales bacterium]|nr:nucleosidase [Hyphomicrobiales bacterium]
MPILLPHDFRPMATPEDAVAELERLHAASVLALREALALFFRSGRVPDAATRARFHYPELRVSYAPHGATAPTRRAFAKFPTAGLYRTTITHPEAFRKYLLEQLRPLVDEFGAQLDVGTSAQEIPYPYVFERGDELAMGGSSAAELARHFPVPLLSEVGDEIADGLWDYHPGKPRPLSLFDAVRVDYSLRRLVHYTGTDWRDMQPWILLTNYHRYVDQFIAWGLQQIRANGPYETLILPGGHVIDARMSDAEAQAVAASAPWHRFQMPAYHVTTADGQGITLVNIGVGPANAKNITDHLAVLRPHCWLMVGHCGGLRESQKIGDYVLAHAYLREDRILDKAVPTGVPIPALAEVQVALQQAAAAITGE